MGQNYIRTLSLPKQAYLLKMRYPDSTSTIKDSILIWHAQIKPTALSRTYNIKLVYKKSFRPKIYLCGDYIRGIEKHDFPHHYKIKKNGKEVELCLCLPCEFDNSKIIADTLIPWAQEWLYYYEIWLITDKWIGGGHHPVLKKSK